MCLSHLFDGEQKCFLDLRNPGPGLMSTRFEQVMSRLNQLRSKWRSRFAAHHQLHLHYQQALLELAAMVRRGVTRKRVGE